MVRLHCSRGWSADGLGRLPGGFFCIETVKSFDEPHPNSIENSHVGGGSCDLCYSCHDFHYPVYLLGTFWGWLMDPHGGLSLRGGTGCPAPHWNLERWTQFHELQRQPSHHGRQLQAYLILLQSNQEVLIL